MILGFLNIGGMELTVFAIPLLATLVLSLIALVKCVLNKQFSPLEKAVWVLVICLVPFIGALAYLIAYGGKK